MSFKYPVCVRALGFFQPHSCRYSSFISSALQTWILTTRNKCLLLIFSYPLSPTFSIHAAFFLPFVTIFQRYFCLSFFFSAVKILFHILLSMAVTIGNSWLKSRFAFWRARFSSGIPCMILLFLIFTNLSRHWPVLILYSYSSQIIFIKAWRCTSAFTHGTERKQLSVSCHIFS